MELQGEEMALRMNSAYGHGHMIHRESAPHNHTVPSSAAAIVHQKHQHQQLPITNGPTIIVPPPPPPFSSSMAETGNNRLTVSYRECLKNHAASIGASATDGCGEFMPSDQKGTLQALTCSVCNCHRNFHRKEIEGEVHRPLSLYHSPPPHLNRISLGYNHNNAGVLVHSRGLPSESDEQEDGGGFMSRYPQLQPHQMVKKRSRTKFTQEQKEKMLSFAEKVGWKIQTEEESVVQRFCQELGIKRSVLKIWMHNNKQNLAKKINHMPTSP